MLPRETFHIVSDYPPTSQKQLWYRLRKNFGYPLYKDQLSIQKALRTPRKAFLFVSSRTRYEIFCYLGGGGGASVGGGGGTAA